MRNHERPRSRISRERPLPSPLTFARRLRIALMIAFSSSHEENCGASGMGREGQRNSRGEEIEFDISVRFPSTESRARPRRSGEDSFEPPHPPTPPPSVPGVEDGSLEGDEGRRRGGNARWQVRQGASSRLAPRKFAERPPRARQKPATELFKSPSTPLPVSLDRGAVLPPFYSAG